MTKSLNRINLTYEFQVDYGKPILYKNGIGQFDTNDNLIEEFVCKYDCIKKLKMGDKTLAKVLSENIPYNGFYFKELGSKLNHF